ncbi:MAG: hypothetical protein WA825_08350 [Steroidobacteraceae bacterium]
MKLLLRPGLYLMLLGLFTLTSANADEPIPPRFPALQITTDQWKAYLAEVKALPDVQCMEDRINQLTCNSSEQHTIWVFTTPGHPAHPAVSRGVIVMQQTAKGATVSIDRSGHYAGHRAEFDVWMRQFAMLDRTQVAQWQSSLKGK